MGDDEDFIMEEFEWALKDPTEEKLRELGEVVSTITKKLIEFIEGLQSEVATLRSEVGGLESQIGSMQSKLASGSFTPSSSGPSDAADAAPAMAKAPIARAPPPKPAGGGGGGGMMGELKALLAARRKKAEGS
ncbi:MAG: hypothetical protein BAJATHORv1_50199 [Candidatus Thorarchaeota archaeon]|nr:MAG: hypothetical protein BAJATHORv1_50199 [Candidatus Thorarchaeota archaeon]